MFIESRERLRRRRKIKDKPRSYLLKRRYKKEKMSYQLRQKLARYEARLPPVQVFDHDEYFPDNRLYKMIGSLVDFCVNAFFICLALFLIWINIMLMGPSWILVEGFMDPMMETLSPSFDVSEEQLEKITRQLIVKNVFALV